MPLRFQTDRRAAVPSWPPGIRGAADSIPDEFAVGGQHTHRRAPPRFLSTASMLEAGVVKDVSGITLGTVAETSPGSDSIIGYSGPTNTLLAFDEQGAIIGLRILGSGDTPDHLAEVIRDRSFFKRFHGLRWAAILEGGRCLRSDAHQHRNRGGHPPATRTGDDFPSLPRANHPRRSPCAGTSRCIDTSLEGESISSTSSTPAAKSSPSPPAPRR